MVDTVQLEQASVAYYAGSPTMTDAEFDTAITELRSTDPYNPFLKRVGAPIPGTKKVEHAIPMGSLSNANNADEFRAWIPDDKPQICLSFKLDGSSLELVYNNGHFVQAITRGDGEVGEDVTRNVLLSNNVPLKIHPSITSVRCECLIYLDDWHEHFEGDANPRNSAAGTLRRHDGRNAKYLQFYAFDALIDSEKATDEMVEADECEQELLLMLSEWFQIPDYVCRNDPYSLASWYKEIENIRDAFEYEIDGIVAKIDDRIRSKKMGIRDGRPKGQIAIKFKPRGGETILREVVWQIGHTGALTPVGIVDPITVGGTTIRRVTLCNVDEIARLDIAIGDTVEIIRAGDVIPKLSRRVLFGMNRGGIYPPLSCPECGHHTMVNGARIFCPNEQCSGRSSSGVMSWIRKRNILNLGVGLISAADMGSILDLYKMELSDWAEVQVGNGIFGEKRAAKVMEALEKSKSVSLPEFLGSIGIKGVGRSLSKTLCDGLGVKTLDDVFDLIPSQIARQESFGESRAIDFFEWLLHHKDEVMELADMMNFHNEPSKDGGVFDGETICFTGKSPKPRTEMSSLAECAGASVSSSVGSSTTILVIADTNSTSAKAVKARESGVKLMSPEDFLSMIG